MVLFRWCAVILVPNKLKHLECAALQCHFKPFGSLPHLLPSYSWIICQWTSSTVSVHPFFYIVYPVEGRMGLLFQECERQTIPWTGSLSITGQVQYLIKMSTLQIFVNLFMWFHCRVYSLLLLVNGGVLTFVEGKVSLHSLRAGHRLHFCKVSFLQIQVQCINQG